MATLLTFALILASDGSVDESASLSASKGAILKYKAERETEQATIADAVGAIFDERKGANLNMPFVTGEALRRLNVQPENHKVLSEKVAQYVRDNAQGKTAEDKSVERPDSTFIITKGKGGGVKRRCDLPTDAAADSAE